MAEKPKTWKDMLDEKAVAKEAEKRINPKLDLPAEGDTPIAVRYAEPEPRLVENEKLPNGYAFYIDVYHDGVKKSVVCPTSILQHTAAILKREKMKDNEWNRLSVMIGADTADIEMKDGSVIKDAKVYWLQLLKVHPTGQKGVEIEDLK